MLEIKDAHLICKDFAKCILFRARQISSINLVSKQNRDQPANFAGHDDEDDFDTQFERDLLNLPEIQNSPSFTQEPHLERSTIKKNSAGKELKPDCDEKTALIKG